MEHIKTTRDVILKVAEDTGSPKKLIEKQYYFWLENLTKLKGTPENVAFIIQNFGTLYIDLTSAAAYEYYYRDNGLEELIPHAEAQITEIYKRVAANEEKGIKKQPFLKRRKYKTKPFNN